MQAVVVDLLREQLGNLLDEVREVQGMCREITEDIHGIDKRLALLDRDRESTDNALATVGVRLNALEKIGGPPRETAVPPKPESKSKGKAAAWVGSAIAAFTAAIVGYFKAKN